MSDSEGKATAERRYNDKGRLLWRPLFVAEVVPWRALLVTGPSRAPPTAGFLRSSGERGLTFQHEHFLVMADTSNERVVLFLKPSKLGLQVANALLETAHFRDHARVRTADVAE